MDSGTNVFLALIGHFLAPYEGIVAPYENMLAPFEAMLALCEPILSSCWAYVGPMLGICWAYLDVFLAYYWSRSKILTRLDIDFAVSPVDHGQPVVPIPRGAEHTIDLNQTSGQLLEKMEHSGCGSGQAEHMWVCVKLDTDDEPLQLGPLSVPTSMARCRLLPLALLHQLVTAIKNRLLLGRGSLHGPRDDLAAAWWVSCNCVAQAMASFDELLASIGHRTIDEIFPALGRDMPPSDDSPEDPSPETARPPGFTAGVTPPATPGHAIPDMTGL